MNDIVIKAENLGKQYVIGHQAEKGSYLSLRDVLMQDTRTLVENLLRQDLTSIEEAEALKSLMDEQKYIQEQLGGIIGKAQGKMRDCVLFSEGKWGAVPVFSLGFFPRFFPVKSAPGCKK